MKAWAVVKRVMNPPAWVMLILWATCAVLWWNTTTGELGGQHAKGWFGFCCFAFAVNLEKFWKETEGWAKS